MTTFVTTCGSTVIEEDDYTYPTPGAAHSDEVSVKQVTRLTAGGTDSYYEVYTYDALNQLTSDTRYSGTFGEANPTVLASETFAYDSLGNLTNLNSAGAGNVDIMNQYLADADSHTLTYDKANAVD